LGVRLKIPIYNLQTLCIIQDFHYKNKPHNAPNYTLIIPAVAVNMESLRCSFTGEGNHPQEKNEHRKIGTDQQHGCSGD